MTKPIPLSPQKKKLMWIPLFGFIILLACTWVNESRTSYTLRIGKGLPRFSFLSLCVRIFEFFFVGVAVAMIPAPILSWLGVALPNWIAVIARCVWGYIVFLFLSGVLLHYQRYRLGMDQ